MGAPACASLFHRKEWISTAMLVDRTPALMRARNERRRYERIRGSHCRCHYAAEDAPDLLEGLVERTATDPGAPFAPDTLARLVALKKDDRAAFEALRTQLKKVGCRITALDQVISEENGNTAGVDRRRPTSWSIWRSRPSCSTPRTAQVSPTSTLTATGRLGQTVPRASAAGWRAASSKQRRAHQAPRPCNRR